MKTVIATVIEKNEYRIKIDVENDATEDEIWDAVKEAYIEDDYNNVDSHYDITITKIVGE
jgi:ABC-type multidrug transport system fused ATPase/permease subunit